MNSLKIITEKSMNKWIISATIIIIFGLVIGVTSFKVVDNHNDKLLLVEEKYIIEAAKKCKIEKECNNDTITLKELYNLKYLEKQVNPVTKEYYSEDAYVTLKNNEYVFIN